MRKKTRKIAVGGVSSFTILAFVLGFIFLPSVFAAKYSGPGFNTKDRKDLVTFIRLPKGDGPFPTLVVQSSYELPHTPLSGHHDIDFTNVPYVDLGNIGWPEITNADYELVIQHTRGRVGSEGTALGMDDRKDAVALTKWIRAQPWSNGKIVTTRDSIEAITAILTNAESDAKINASYVQICTPNLVNGALLGPGGALKLETFLPWGTEQILTADDNHYLEMGYNSIERRTSIVQMGLTLKDLLSDIENAHEVAAWQNHAMTDYPHFSKASLSWNKLLKATPNSDVAKYYDATISDVPTLYVAAWFVVFAPPQLTSFANAEQNNNDQHLLIWNGTHFTPEGPVAWPIQPMLPWFDYHLQGDTSAYMDMPCVIFPIANADDEWYGTQTWPPAAASKVKWYLTKTGEVILDTKLVANQTGLLSYKYDPNNPVPTVGGRNLMISHRVLDQSSVRQNKCSNVLSHDCEILEKEVIISGHVFSTISVSSDAP